MSVISVRGLSVKLGDQLILEDISFEVDKPSLIMIIGPNGAGKTTLLKTLLGIIKPIKGEVRVLGLNPVSEGAKARGLIGYVPQRDKAAYDVPLRVSEVALMGIVLRKRPPRYASKEDIERARRALAYLGMEDKWDAPFNMLSGGQQKRVLIARALASDPSLLLLDEVFSGLDIESQEKLLGLLGAFKERGKTILIVEHELDPVVNLADKILVLNRRVYAYGGPESILNEDNLKPVYPCLKTIEREGRRIIVLGDRHA